MAKLETTGSFHLAIGKAFESGIDLKAGLDAITTFRRECRKRVSSPDPTRKTP